MPKILLQGDYDGLCGLYAALNAANALLRMNEKDREKLFKNMVYLVSKKENFADTILNGIDADQMEELLELIISYSNEEYGRQLVKESLSTDENNAAGVWRNFSNFLNVDDEHSRIIVIGLENRCDHWTCVRKITGRSLHLIDSFGMMRINKSAITTGKKVRKHYRIVADEVWGLYVKKL
ncbi:MAG TPA: hypothetical protein DDZ34_08465 [Syntrophaceae bacterium]|nr:hypothetical protein [Syntrophaceae bacterium]